MRVCILLFYFYELYSHFSGNIYECSIVLLLKYKHKLKQMHFDRWKTKIICGLCGLITKCMWKSIFFFFFTVIVLKYRHILYYFIHTAYTHFPDVSNKFFQKRVAIVYIIMLYFIIIVFQFIAILFIKNIKVIHKYPTAFSNFVSPITNWVLDLNTRKSVIERKIRKYEYILKS